VDDQGAVIAAHPQPTPAGTDVTLKPAVHLKSTAMLTVNKLIPQGRGLAKALLHRASSVTLDWDTRQKSRFDADDSSGRNFGVFLPRGSVARGGDVLVAEDGSLIQVLASQQTVMVVRACPEHGEPIDLLRAAYHLGNRHVQLEIQPDRLQLEPDHVLADMLRQMHLIVTEESAAFEPEGGAYAAAGGHVHDHGHGHVPQPSRTPIAIAVKAAPAPHVHGPGCDHDHEH